MKGLLRLFTAFILLAAAFSSADAQVIPDSLASRRIRVFLDPIDREVEGYGYAPIVRGTLMNVTADSIRMVIHDATSPMTIASTGIRRIDVSRGVSRSRSALGVGVLWGLTWGSLSSFSDREDDMWLWAAGGFALGAVFGAIFPQEHWKRVYRK